MSVTVAKTAGFCFGVRRAVDLAEQQAKKNGKIYAYGEIIHNMHEIERLEKLGVYTAYALEDIPDGAGVLIRAHGVPRNVYTLLQAKKCEIFDATCPFVRKIHKIVDKESADGRLIVILGSAGHPEVVGIQGWCGESVVLEGEEQARAFSERPEMENKPISLVVQTTVNRSIWNISVGLIKKRCTNLKIFDTICKATDERQSEARLLAGVSDQMIVIGDKKSSNTKRLYEISRSLCSDVRYIEDAAELTTQELGQHQHIGITAGASTPAWIIKEVSNMMSEETKIETGEDFAAMLEESFKTLN
uniref:4-hydroxy-3-methylbut-2-enyl diphosphate reductase n=1 Tax=Agathobaculum sp. TaxID=2048138 RepID=UPI003AB39729